ncbi:MAG: hypothetical protein NZT92_10415 [Abditibacteriales bacterium]|nr:hypothetical protein [Abditibacteriales bacterium]MDW8365563.1 hypothetical protein [Abditibacteriales bacterium]
MPFSSPALLSPDSFIRFEQTRAQLLLGVLYQRRGRGEAARLVWRFVYEFDLMGVLRRHTITDALQNTKTFDYDRTGKGAANHRRAQRRAAIRLHQLTPSPVGRSELWHVLTCQPANL